MIMVMWFFNPMLNLIIERHFGFFVKLTSAEFPFLFPSVVEYQLTQAMESIILEHSLVNLPVWESLQPASGLLAVFPFTSIGALILPKQLTVSCLFTVFKLARVLRPIGPMFEAFDGFAAAS